MIVLSRPSQSCLPVLAALLLALGYVLFSAQPLRAQNAASDPPARVGRLALIDGTVCIIPRIRVTGRLRDATIP